tara:strand:- start:1640 stop:2428 length:789 start_codon:yes stop_codon:yes gene_type:complete
MKYDLDHSTAYFQQIFSGVSNNDMTGGVEALESLSTYLKKNHYLLNKGATEYKPPSWSEQDNIFPSDAPVHPMTHIEWAAILKGLGLEGDALEFGVASGGTIRDFAVIEPSKRFHGFDHFQGLEKTNQFIPTYAGWHEGAFALDGPEYKQTYETVIDDLSQFENIGLIVEDVHNLEEPSEYDIDKICAVHIDVDIYEPTVSSLNFVDKCEWNKIYMRFDDWHGHEPHYDNHERLACKEWIDKNGYEFELLRNGLHGEMIVTR